MFSSLGAKSLLSIVHRRWCSELFVGRAELTNWQELALVGTIFATHLSGLLIFISVQVVVMNMLGAVLSLGRASVRVNTTV